MPAVRPDSGRMMPRAIRKAIGKAEQHGKARQPFPGSVMVEEMRSSVSAVVFLKAASIASFVLSILSTALTIAGVMPL